MVLGFFSVHWSFFCRDEIWAVRVVCWSLLILTLENLLVNNQKICQLVVKLWIACNWPWRVYLHYGNCQVLQAVVFPPGELVVKHLPAQHWFVISTIPGLWFWRAGAVGSSPSSAAS